MTDTQPCQTGQVRRRFVDIAEGQVHYREAGTNAPGQLPLVMLHPSPGSSLMLAPLIRRFAETRYVYAPDTLGNGDSSPPPRDPNRDITLFVDAHLRALDTLGIERFDLYGSHTGANIACEIAIREPERVHRMIVDGMSVYAEEERDDMLANYAPGVTIDQNGAHMQWIWNFVRDTFLFWPWYRRDAAHVRDVGLPPADVLHDKVVEVLKAARTYHLSYQAALAYPKDTRLPLVTTPTLLACARNDMLVVYFDAVAALLPQAERLLTEGSLSENAAQETVSTMTEFLDRGG